MYTNTPMIYRDIQGRMHEKPKWITPKWRESTYGYYAFEGRILFVQPIWNTLFELPGGKVEKNENLDTSLRREFMEETGYEIDIMDSKPVITLDSKFYSDDVDIYYDTRLHFFRIWSVRSYDINRIREDEIAKVEWINKTELEKNKIHPIHYEIIKII